MAVIIKGQSNGVGANVDANGYIATNNPLNPNLAGAQVSVGEVSDGSNGTTRIVRSSDISPDYRTRVGLDSLLWNDVFNHTQFNTSKYGGTESTMTKALTGTRLAFNNGNSVASGAVARVQTYRTFPLYLSYALYCDMEVLFTQTPIANNVCEFGLGYASGVTTPTDGVFFRLNGTQLQGIINNNGTETSVVLPFSPVANSIYHYLITIHNDTTSFIIDDVTYGTITTPTTIGSPCLSMSLPLLLREYNSNTTSVAQRMELASISISLADMNSTRLWATAMAGMGNSAMNVTDGTAAGQTANYANSAAPTSATLSNTAAGYTTLGGQWQFAAVAGAETDFALFGFLNPVSSASVPGRNLIIRGIRIETFNMGAAVATTPHLLQWGIGVGSTGVSLAVTDSATASTRAPRRIALGVQTLPVAAAIGTSATAIDINLDAPVIVEPSTYFHVILKIPVGTATASQIIRGTCFINGFFE